MSLTYKDLYTLVIDELNKRLAFPNQDRYGDQLDRSQTSQDFTSTSSLLSTTNTVDVTNAVMDLLSEVLPPRIRSGLTVEATSPTSSQVIVKAGSGTVGGKVYVLDADTTVPIPLDTNHAVYYISLWINGIEVTTNPPKKDRLLIAKVINPNPGMSSIIKNKREDDYPDDAYIVNMKEVKLHSDAYGNLEEDSIDFLRDNITPILADNIIGNIRLSENLKIINTAGTLELNSDSLKLYDENSKLLSKFNEKGVYFYNTDGIELARFTNIDARIGNILITKNSLQSTNFASGNTGFKIDDTGEAEFENVTIRGRFHSSVFEYDKTSAVGGQLIVSNASSLAATLNPTDTTITVADSVFNVNDVLYIKEGNDEEYMLVTDTTNAPTYTVTRDISNAYSGLPPTWNEGTAIVSLGTINSGYIKLDAVSNYSPFIDIILRNSTTYNDITTKVRLGNLSGITDSMFGALSGYGLYSDNVYLKGSLYSPTIKTAISGSRIELTTDGLFLYDDSDNKLFGALLTSISGYGDIGDIIIGDKTNNNYMEWDASSSTLTVRGDIVTDSLSTGSSAPKITIDSNGMSAFDATNREIFNISLTGTNIGDIIIGDTSAYIQWDDSEDTICVYGATIQTIDCGSGNSARTVFDAYGIKSYDSSGNKKLDICDGHIEAQDIKLQDPNCACCYSYLDGGALKFHDECGDVPYVKRICSGVANTGDTVCLPGWKTAPEVIIGIKSLNSFDAGHSTQTQQWNVYATNICCYVESGNNYGYCFDVHAELVLAEGQANECIKDIAFDTCTTTDTDVCQTIVRTKYQLWCNADPPSNYYYGVICYAICYRCYGCNVWCACCSSYTQPHSTVTELKTTGDSYLTLCFPCSAQWELMAHCVSLTWYDSSLVSGGCECCVCCRHICHGVSTSCWGYSSSCSSPVSCTFCCEILLEGSSPSNVYCAIFCSKVCNNQGSWGACLYLRKCAYRSSVYTYFYVTAPGSGNCCRVYTKAGCLGCSIFDDQSCCVSYHDCTHRACCCDNYDHLRICTSGCAIGSDGGLYKACFCWDFCVLQDSYLIQCYYVYSGSAATCEYKRFYSICDTYSCRCVLDPNGVLNWLAIAYS